MAVIDTSMDLPKSCDKCKKPNCKGALVPWGDIEFPLSQSSANFMNARLPDCPLKSADEMIKEIRQEHEEEWKQENYDTSFGLSIAIDIIHKYCDVEGD